MSFEEIQKKAYFIHLRNKTLSDKECWDMAQREIEILEHLSVKTLKDVWGENWQ